MKLWAAQAAEEWTRQGTNGFLGPRKRAGARQSIAVVLILMSAWCGFVPTPY